MLQITQKLLKVNFTKGRAQFRPEIIVIHIGEALQNQIWLTFLNEEKSSHYCVDKTGEIWQFVKEEDTAFTQGIVDNPVSKYVLEHKGINPNLYSIGIENAGFGNQDFTPEQYQANAELVADICKRWLIPLDNDHIIRHNYINTGKTCPGIVSVDKIIAMAKKQTETKPKLEIIQKQVSILSQIVALLIKIKNLYMSNPLKKFGADGVSYPALLASSVDSHKISATIKSLAVLIPFIVLTAKYFHLELGEGELNEVLELASDTILAVGTAVSAGTTLFFAARKILVKLDIY